MILIRPPLRAVIVLPFRSLPRPLRTFTTCHPAYSPQAKTKAKAKSTSARSTKPEPAKRTYTEPKQTRVRTSGGKTWTQVEENHLLRLREQKTSWHEIEKQFPDRTMTSILQKYARIAPRGPGGRFVHSNRFNDAERALLVKLRSEGLSWPEIHMSHFPNRKLKSLVENAHRSRLEGDQDYVWKYYAWSAADQKKLVRLREVRKLEWKAIAPVFGRTPAAVRGMYKRIVDGREGEGQYVVVQSSKLWSEKDEAKLVEMIRSGATNDAIVKKFPMRSETGVKTKARKMRRRQGLGLAPRPPVAPKVDAKSLRRAMRLRNEGATLKQIAQLMPDFEFGELRYAIYQELRRLKEDAATEGRDKKETEEWNPTETDVKGEAQ